MRPARRLAVLPAAVACAALLSACSEDHTGPATVTVLDGTPVAGADVVFHDPDGSVRARAVTGTDGKATAVVPRGAMATVARFFPGTTGTYSLATVAGLDPGDDVAVRPPSLPQGRVGQVEVTLPGAYPGATGYRVDVGCDFTDFASADLPVIVTVVSPCGTTVSAVAVAHGALGDLAFSTAADVALSGAPPSATGSVVLPAWRTDFGSLALGVSNAPAGASVLSAMLQPRRNGVRFYGAAASAALVPGGSAALAVPFVQGLGASARLGEIVFYETSGSIDGRGLWLANDLDPSMARSLDLSTLPPRLSPPSLSGTPGALVGSWTSGGADPALDAQYLHFIWQAPAALYPWDVMLPPGATSFAFPRIPDDLAAFLPPPAAALLGGSVEAVDVSTVVGYAAFKAAYSTSFMQALPEGGAYTVRASTGFIPPF